MVWSKPFACFTSSVRRRVLAPILSSGRGYCTSREKWLDVSLLEKSGIATMRLQKAPANTLSLDYMTDILIALENLENNRHCRGLVLTSGVEGIFSAGLELTQVYNAKEDALRQMLQTFEDIWLRLYGSRLATVMAVNGHAPAGGCILTLACDYRIMAQGNGLIGATAAKLGITMTQWLQKVIIQTVGHREAERCVTTGSLYTPSAACQAGLVDEVVSQEKLYTTAVSRLEDMLQVPDVARQLTKEAMRRPVLDAITVSRDRDLTAMLAHMMDDRVQALIGSHLERLKSSREATQ